MLRLILISSLLFGGCSTPQSLPAPGDYFPLVSQKFAMLDTCFASVDLRYYSNGQWVPGTAGSCGQTFVDYEPVPAGSECTNAPSIAKTQTKNDILAYWQQGYPGAWDSEVYTKEPDGSVSFNGLQGGESPSGPTDNLIPTEISITNYVTSGHGAPILPSYADQKRVLAGEQITYYGSEDSYIVNGAQTYECLATPNAVRINSFYCPPGKTCVLSENWKALFHTATLDTTAYRGEVIASDLYEIKTDHIAETHYFAPGLGLVQIDGFDHLGNLIIRVEREP